MREAIELAGVPVAQFDRISEILSRVYGIDTGPILLQDHHFREKITHFDHERIPERIVHARGAAAHGYFQPYESAASLSRAAFLQDPSKKTPVFVRLSTVVGFRGSTFGRRRRR